jgi:hypothetical protein
MKDIWWVKYKENYVKKVNKLTPRVRSVNKVFQEWVPDLPKMW